MSMLVLAAMHRHQFKEVVENRVIAFVTWLAFLGPAVDNVVPALTLLVYQQGRTA
jgi:hypothetical protein